MTSFASTVLALVVVAVVAAPAARADSPPDSAWTARVEAAVSARWNVPAGALRVAWGRLPAGGLPAGEASFRLVGGADGWFVLSATGGDGLLAVARVRAGVEDTVCVAAHDLVRGQHLVADDLRLESRVRWGTPRADGVGARPVAGWEVRRAVAAGTLLGLPTAVPPAVVRVGDRIEIEWMRGEVALHLSGVALHGARLGEALRVRVDGRNRPLTAIVDAAGHARIGTREAS